MIDFKASMGGHLAGIGVRHADGSEDFKFLENGPHNTIVTCGIDHLFMMNGTPTGAIGALFNTSGNPIPQWVSRVRVAPSDIYQKATGQYYMGVLGAFKVGTDGSDTEVGDTELHAPVTSYSFSRKTSTTIPYSGTIVNGYGNETFRVTSVSNAVSEACTIRELGWYGSYGATETYRMFARIVLTVPLELNAGDSVIATYQLTIQHAYADETDIENIGILDKDANNAGYGATVRYYNWYAKSSSNPAGYTMGAPYITTSGNDSVYAPCNMPGYGYIERVPVSFLYAYNVYPIKLSNWTVEYDEQSIVCQYSTSSSKTFPSKTATSLDTANMTTLYNNSQTIACTRTVSPYVPGSGYRDYSLKLWGGASTTNIYYLRTHGMDYRFFKKVDGEKVYTPLVIEPNDAVTLNFRVSYATDI